MALFLLIGCDDNGIHTEASITARVLSDAVVIFAKDNIGPVTFIEVARRMLDSNEINSGDLAVLEAAEKTGKVDISEIERYKELIEKVDERVLDTASVVFNFGSGSCGGAYDGHDHNNYVDGDSVSQWKIYQVEPGPATEYSLDDTYPILRIYPIESDK